MKSNDQEIEFLTELSKKNKTYAPTYLFYEIKERIARIQALRKQLKGG